MSAQPTMAEEIKTNVAIDALAVAYLPRFAKNTVFLRYLDTATISAAAAEKGIHGIARSEDVGRDKRRSDKESPPADS